MISVNKMTNKQLLLPQMVLLSAKVEEIYQEMVDMVARLPKYESNIDQAVSTTMEIEETLSPQIIAERSAIAKSLKYLEKKVANLDSKNEVIKFEIAQIEEKIIFENLPEIKTNNKWKHQDIINPSKFRAPSGNSTRSHPYRPNNKWIKDSNIKSSNKWVSNNKTDPNSKFDRYKAVGTQSQHNVWTPNQNNNARFTSDQKWKKPEHPESTSVIIAEYESLSQY